MKKTKVRSKSKINIGLDVISKREDGYHNIRTIMHELDLFDEMEFSLNASGFEIISGLNIKMEDNLIYKAYRGFCDYVGEDLNLKVSLKKLLPMGAGIAGGTFNGAETIKYLNRAYGYNMKLDELIGFSKKIGADFPYCLTGGNCLAEGIGEILVPVEYSEPYVLLVNPGYEVSTKEVYENLRLSDKRVDFEKIIDALQNRNVSMLNDVLKNNMEDYVFKKHGELDIINKRIVEFGGASAMSGSGPSIFGIFYDLDLLKGAYKYFKDRYKNVYLGGNYE